MGKLTTATVVGTVVKYTKIERVGIHWVGFMLYVSRSDAVAPNYAIAFCLEARVSCKWEVTSSNSTIAKNKSTLDHSSQVRKCIYSQSKSSFQLQSTKTLLLVMLFCISKAF